MLTRPTSIFPVFSFADSVPVDRRDTRYYGASMRRVFKTKVFIRWNKKVFLSDNALRKAVDEMERGLIDANLGGIALEDKVYKKRIPLPGKGKSGGVRTIVATSKGGRWFFLYGFEKSDRENITTDELAAFRDIAAGWLAASNENLAIAIAEEELEEICDEHS